MIELPQASIVLNCLTFHRPFILYHTQACRSKFGQDFLICADCHRAGYYKLVRDQVYTRQKHKLKCNDVEHSQFTFRMRFWSEKALCAKEKDLDSKLTKIYGKDEFWCKIGEEEQGCANNGSGESNVWNYLPFYVGESEDAKAKELNQIIGQVHDVEGDGNCGFYCLLMALAVFVSEEESRPTDQLTLRRRLQEKAPGLQDEMLKLEGFEMLDDEDCVFDLEELAKYLFREDIDYEDEDFMTNPDNKNHWMDGDLVSYIFASVYRLRVALYTRLEGDKNWLTHTNDGRSGTVESTFKDGLVKVGGERTFGMYYDGKHFQYIVLPMLEEG
jgi:hypothetical protein